MICIQKKEKKSRKFSSQVKNLDLIKFNQIILYIVLYIVHSNVQHYSYQEHILLYLFFICSFEFLYKLYQILRKN